MGYKPETIAKLWDKAKMYDERHKRALGNLRSKPWAARTFFFWRYTARRAVIKHLEWMRLAHVAMALAAVRKNKLEERAYRAHYPHSNN